MRDIYSILKEIKQKAKKTSQVLYSNIYQFYDQNTEKTWCDCRVAHASLLYSYCDDREIRRVYFASYDLCELSEELAHFPKDAILDYVCKGTNLIKQYILGGGFEEIASYVRKSTNLLAEGKEFKRSHSEMLDSYYDENIGEYAKENDAEEIVQLLEEVFDKEIDHIPTVAEIREYAKKNWILVYRVLGKIRALYLYQIQGKKFYSNISYNSVPAIILYCLEKRAHMEVMENYDVVMKYSWINTQNQRSLRRNVLKYDDVYTYIYKKV